MKQTMQYKDFEIKEYKREGQVTPIYQITDPEGDRFDIATSIKQAKKKIDFRCYQLGLDWKTMYVYKQSEPGLWTVGFYTPEGKWIAESDWSDHNEAAERVRYLNGG